MTSPVDRRAAERFPVNADVTCPHVSPVVENFGAVKVRDVSMTGIGLIVSRRVEPGALIAVTLTNVAKSYTRTVLVRVTHATALAGNYLIGGAFVEPLSYQEMSILVL